MSFKHLLCVSNLSSASTNTHRAALKLAKQFNAKLTILSCGDVYPYSGKYFNSEGVHLLQTESEQNLDFIKRLEERKTETTTLFTELQQELKIDLTGSLSYEITLENEVTSTLDLIEKQPGEFDLVIACKQNSPWWERFLFGSPGKEICDESKISTLLIPSDEKWKNWTPTGVVVATAIPPQNPQSHIAGVNFCQKFSAPLTLLNIIDLDTYEYSSHIPQIFPIDYIPPHPQADPMQDVVVPMKQSLEKIKNTLIQTSGYTNIRTRIETGKIGESIVQILKASPENNLLIISSSKGNALQRFFLGSNADSIEAACFIPILIVFNS